MERGQSDRVRVVDVFGVKVDLAQARWFKSSRSGGSKECVEVAFLGEAVGVRDSKHPTGPALVFAPGEWDSFAAAIGAGRFDAADME